MVSPRSGAKVPTGAPSLARIEKDKLGHVKRGETLEESPFHEIAHAQQRALLVAFLETGNVRRACKVAKVARSSHYRWLEQHKAYREAFQRGEGVRG